MQCPRCNAGQISDLDNQCPECAFSLLCEKVSDDVSAEVERGIRRAFRPEFRIEGLLGRGGMSLVYLAHEVELNRFVALKVLPLQLTLGTDAAERFKREAKIAASLDHPHIVPIHQVGSRSTFLWFTMKFVKGQSLVELVAQRGPLELEECLAFVEQIASALHYAHDRGVVHRDVKPANIMIDENGWALVCDFGVAKAFGSVALTQTGGTMGTPSHMSPEQLYGQPLSGRSDQYSLAIMTYELLAGKPPFSGASLGEILRQHCLEPPPRLSDHQPEIPGHVSDALIRAMSKEPEERFESVLDFVAALGERTLGATGEEAVRPDLLETTAPINTWHFGRRSRLPSGHLPLVAGFSGVLFAISVGLTSLGAPMPRDSQAQTLEPQRFERFLPDPIAYEFPIRTDAAAQTDDTTVPADAGAAAPAAAQRNSSPVETLSKVLEAEEAGPRPVPESQRNPQRTADRARVATPPPRRTAPDPRVEIERVVQNLERAIESRDVSRFRAVHRNLTDEDQSAWDGFFQSLQTLDVTLTIRALEVAGDLASATLAQRLEYQRKDGSSGQHADELRVSFEKTTSGWRLTAIKN